MKTIQVLFCGSGWHALVDVIRRVLSPDCDIRIRDPRRPTAEQLRPVQVILPSNMPLNEAAISAAPELLLIQQPAAGYEGIDIQAARQRGIPVCNAPAVNSDSMAQAALLLMLCLARRLREAGRMFREARIGAPVGMELTGRTLGIIGLGRSGRSLAAAVAPLGMTVRTLRSSDSRETLRTLLQHSDFVSLHCPLTARTRGLLCDETLSWLKPGAAVINCARAEIIDRGAIERALDGGLVSGLGLDVHWSEPWDPADPLYQRDDVMALPHVGGSTAEAYERTAGVVAENIRRVRAGEPLLHRVDEVPQ